MATLLDISLLGHFQVLFPFLLIFTLSYAILIKINIFKDNKSMNAFISFLLAMISLFSDVVRETVNTAAPWFILLFIFIIFILIAYMALGATESDIVNVIKSENYSYINVWVIAIALIIIIGSLTHVLAQKGGIGAASSSAVANTTTNSSQVSAQEDDFWKTIVHPKVLGLALIFLISLFTIQRLAGE